MGLYLRQLPIGPMQNFVYLIGNEERPEETAVIDAAWDVPAILRVAEADGRKITHALVTHRHADHSNGVAPLLELLPVQVFAHRDDADFLAGDIPPGVVTSVSGGDVVDVGGVRIHCVHTPGHTPGSQCFHVEVGSGALLSGDTLFVNACGRCDFSGGNPEQMYESLHHVLGALPSQTTLYPGHDYGDVPVSSLQRERERNPYLLATSVQDFVRYRMRPRG
jgi:glyoxylase-like metal-dependent hydrolase (beta-lactamase superfamily II)